MAEGRGELSGVADKFMPIKGGTNQFTENAVYGTNLGLLAGKGSFLRLQHARTVCIYSLAY